MATITGLTAARMQAIEAASVVSGVIINNELFLTRYDGSTINAGSVQGTVGPSGPDGGPAGMIVMGGWATEPTNYRFLNGQTIVGGVAAFPLIATMYPSWVSSANLVLPNAMDGAVPMGSTGAGILSGSMSRILVENQLPSHSHNVPSHNHTGSTGTDTHSHTYANDGTTPIAVAGGGGTAGSSWRTDTTSSDEHSHSVTIGQSGILTSAAVGSGIPIDITPRNITVKYAVKMV